MKIVVAAIAVFVCTSAIAGSLHPIVDVENGYLFGATSDGKWLKADKVVKTLASSPYQLYGLSGSLGEAKGGKPRPNEEDVCSDLFVVPLSRKPGKAAIALSASWNALPRPLQILDSTQSVYVDATRDFLKSKGIAEPKIKIDRIVRVDLDGDGEAEVLINATNYFDKDEGAPMRSPAGSYSVVLLRRVVSGKVQTRLIAGEFHPTAFTKSPEFDAPNTYKLIAILDLDGDGKMEVVITSQYYEGAETTIYRCGADKIESLLSVGCGV